MINIYLTEKKENHSACIYQTVIDINKSI